MSIRFIHAADFHLDHPYKGLAHLPESIFKRVSEAPFTALHKMVTYAIEQAVDFVVISGDLYDGNNPSMRAEKRFLKEVDRLAKSEIPLYLIHGNHDPLDSRRLNLSHEGLFTFSDNVEMKLFKKEGKPVVHLYGFSYPTRHVTESMTAFYNKKAGADFHIALLHGYLSGSGGHDAYAPFSVKELAAKEFDYWALGHIHLRQQLSPELPIYYSGTPQGLSVKEQGDKGVQLVTLWDGGCAVSFLSTADFVFDTLILNIDGMKEISSFIQAVEALKKEWRSKGQAGLIRLKLEGQSALHQTLEDTHLQKELLDVFHDGEEEEEVFCWVTELIGETLPFYPRHLWEQEPHFLGDLIRMSNQTEEIHPYVDDLFRHTKAKKHLDPLTKEEADDILEKAERYLIRALMDGWKEGQEA